MMHLGQKPKALEYYEQALALLREVGDRAREGTTLNNLGAVYDTLGQKPKALEYYEQALVLTREVGDRAMEADTTLGRILAEVLASGYRMADLRHRDKKPSQTWNKPLIFSRPMVYRRMRQAGHWR